MKKIYLVASFMLLAFFSNAQVTKLTEFETNYLKPFFPVVASVIFIIGVLANLHQLKGEERDIKKFFIGVLIYPAGLLLVVGIYTMIKAITL
jgi:FtsH-binding integral membrane protein